MNELKIRALGANPGTVRAPLYIRDCTPPGAIAQVVHSFDEVSLELAVTCRIDTRTAASAPVPE